MAKHRIVEEYESASDVAQDYLDRLTADILNKQFVGKAADEKTIEGVINFLHSKDVAGMIRKSLGSKAGKFSDEELLERYSLPKHRIKEILQNDPAITVETLQQLVGQLSAQLHGELTSNHPAALANLAYNNMDKAREVLTELYKVSGGERYANRHKKAIDNLKDPSRLHAHASDLYQRLTLHQERQRTHVAKPVYKK